MRLAYAGDGSRLAIGLHFNLTMYDFNADKGTWTYIGAPSGFDQFSLRMESQSKNLRANSCKNVSFRNMNFEQ